MNRLNETESDIFIPCVIATANEQTQQNGVWYIQTLCDLHC